MTDLTQLDAHFALGEKWRSYVGLIDDARIREATVDLGCPLDCCSMLDVGCGSGPSALAALRLGAREVAGEDINPDSVVAADSVLGRFAPGGPWRVSRCSVFELPPEWMGRFDAVSYWSALHHDSVQPAELISRLREQSFESESGPTRGTPIGLFGSGCDEFRFRCTGSPRAHCRPVATT